MSERDAAVLMFLSTLNEASFRGANPARANDKQPDDFVKQFFDDAAFAVQSGVDAGRLERETVRNDERFETFLEKSRAQIAGAKIDRDDPPRSAILFAKRISSEPSEITTRMSGLLTKLRQYCEGSEETQLERALDCLDIPCFAQIAEGIVSRLKARIGGLN